MYKMNPIELHSINGDITNYYNEIITEQENVSEQHSAR